MRLSAILLAAGKGVRLGSQASKPLVKIGHKPLIAYSLAVLNSHPSVKEIVVVVNRGNREKISALIKRQKDHKVSAVVLGGARRQDSVLKGLEALDKRSDSVLIHDSARPFIDAGVVSRVIKAGLKQKASIAAVRVSSTIKSVDEKGLIEKTIKRERLWEAQTPQFFEIRLLEAAYRRCGGSSVTDDASLVEKMGRKVAVAAGSPANIKITTPDDLRLARAISQILE